MAIGLSVLICKMGSSRQYDCVGGNTPLAPGPSLTGAHSTTLQTQSNIGRSIGIFELQMVEKPNHLHQPKQKEVFVRGIEKLHAEPISDLAPACAHRRGKESGASPGSSLWD